MVWVHETAVVGSLFCNTFLQTPAPMCSQGCGAGPGMPVISEIREPGYLEGGDFFPAGEDLSMVGIGLRSNYEACHQLMAEDLLGTRRLAVVRDEFEQHQVSPPTNRTVLGTCWKGRWPLQPCKGHNASSGKLFHKRRNVDCQVLRCQGVGTRPHENAVACRTVCIWTVFSASLAMMCASCWTRCWARTAQQGAWWMSGCVMITMGGMSWRARASSSQHSCGMKGTALFPSKHRTSWYWPFTFLPLP